MGQKEHVFCSQSLSFRKRPDRFCRIPSLLWNGHSSKRPGCEAGHSLPFNADNKSEWHYTTTSSTHSRRAKRQGFHFKCCRFRDIGPKRHELARNVKLEVHFGTYGSNSRQWHSDRTRRFARYVIADKKEASSYLYSYRKTCIGEVNSKHERYSCPCPHHECMQGG